MNDEGHSFKKIANFIEKNYENLWCLTTNP
jgi:hypothetical protein